MLAQLALLLFAWFALVALSVDLGLVSLTRVQMQTAVDASAIEGMRLRNLRDDGYASDCLRRIAARDLVARTFDDDGDPANGDPRQFGAGPLIDMTPGLTPLDAGRTFSLPDPRAYKPRLEFNLGNLPHGDFVDGRYDPTADQSPAAGLEEDAAYARPDFAPAPGWDTASLPPCPAEMPAPGAEPLSGQGGLLSADHEAFLARLRRTPDRDGLDAVPGVSSGAPALPLLFGRGAAVGAAPDGVPSIRRDGIVVRATAIARSRPALRVGLPPADGRVPGALDFAVTRQMAGALESLGAPAAITIAPDGVLTAASDVTDVVGAVLLPAGTVVGRYASSAAAVATVGNLVDVAPSRSCLPGVTGAAMHYAPVFIPLGSPPVDRVVGFVAVRTTFDVCGAVPPTAVTITRGAHGVGWANATAHVPDGLVTDVDGVAVLAAARELAASSIAVMAPVVAR